MPFYENSLVYKLCCNDPEITDIYVGSTCNFRARKYNHKACCNNENRKEHNRYVYKFIRENGGWNNWAMVLIKKYPEVKDMFELNHKERKWMRKLEATLNKNKPCNLLEIGTTEYAKRYNKQYNERNKLKLIDYHKQYRNDNKEKNNEYKQQYREQNREEINQRRREKIQCECGCIVSRGSISIHNTSKKHKQLMNTNINPE